MTENRRAGVAESFEEALRSPYEALMNSLHVIQERNVNYYQSLAEMTAKILREPTPKTYRRNVRALSDQAVKQREALGAAATEAVDAYLNLTYAPFYYLREKG